MLGTCLAIDQSRYPYLYTTQEMNGIVIDLDDNLCISTIVTADLPDAITLKMVQAIRLKNAETTYLHPERLDNR